MPAITTCFPFLKRISFRLFLIAILFAAPAVIFGARPVLAASNEMHRLYNPNSGEHFYTASEAERDMLTGVGWLYEGVGWYAPTVSKTPVYRLYNPNAGDHHYTMSRGERNMLLSVGWRDEGIGWYSDDLMRQPLYRQYNPNAKAGAHNYTTSKAENDMLVSVGWRGEGIAWYGRGTAGYDYEVGVLNTHTVYDGGTLFLYVRTDNPFDYETDYFEIKSECIESTLSLHYGDLGDVPFTDDPMPDGAYYAELARVKDGVVLGFHLKRGLSGTQTFSIFEAQDYGRYGLPDTPAKTFTLEIADEETAEKEWVESLLAKYTEPSMTAWDKLSQIAWGLLGEFQYPDYMIDENGEFARYVFFVSSYGMPWDVKKWDSLESPSWLIYIAEKYLDLKVLSYADAGQPYGMHAYVFSEDGEHFCSACPFEPDHEWKKEEFDSCQKIDLDTISLF